MNQVTCTLLVITLCENHPEPYILSFTRKSKHYKTVPLTVEEFDALKDMIYGLPNKCRSTEEPGNDQENMSYDI